MFSSFSPSPSLTLSPLSPVLFYHIQNEIWSPQPTRPLWGSSCVPYLFIVLLLARSRPTAWPSCFFMDVSGTFLLLDICTFLSEGQKLSILEAVALLMPSCDSELCFEKALKTALDKVPLRHAWALLCFFFIMLFITCHLLALWRPALSLFCSLLCLQHLEQWLAWNNVP